MLDFVLFRSLPNLIFMLLLSFYFGTKVFQLPKMTLGLRVIYLLRLITPSLTFFCMLLALNHMSIAIYTVIFQTNPFLISLVAYIVYRSSICKGELIAMVFCFAAVFAICLDKSSNDNSSAAMHVSSNAKFLGVLFSFLSLLCPTR